MDHEPWTTDQGNRATHVTLKKFKNFHLTRVFLFFIHNRGSRESLSELVHLFISILLVNE